MTGVTKVSRRSFVQTTGLAGSALILGVRGSQAAFLPIPGEAEAATTFEPNVFVAIGEDGVVQLTVHRRELGQGGKTACCMLLAEELDVDIADVRVVQALADPKYGRQHTAGRKRRRSSESRSKLMVRRLVKGRVRISGSGTGRWSRSG